MWQRLSNFFFPKVNPTMDLIDAGNPIVSRAVSVVPKTDDRFINAMEFEEKTPVSFPFGSSFISSREQERSLAKKCLQWSDEEASPESKRDLQRKFRELTEKQYELHRKKIIKMGWRDRKTVRQFFRVGAQGLKLERIFDSKSRILGWIPDAMLPRALETLFCWGFLDYQIFEDLCLAYEAYINDQDQILQEREPDLRIEFKKRIKHSNLPLSEKELDERLDSVQISVEDPIVSGFKERDGAFYAVNKKAVLNALALSEKHREEHVYVHELLHAISGQVFALATVTHESGYESHFVRSARVGLRRNEEMSMPGFLWLNEAVTEQLTLDLLGGSDRGVYRPERDLLSHLIVDGAGEESWDIILKAYFNDDIQDEAWDDLVRHIDQVFGEGYLSKINDLVERYGAATVGLFLAMKH